jgi:hypothetical protein
LDRQCDECPLGKGPCPVFLVQQLHNYDQCDNVKLEQAMNLLINEDGICQVRPQILRANQEAQEPEKPIPVMPVMRQWAEKHGLKVA